MARLVLLALALFALAVGLLDLSARGAFAAPPGPPVAVAGAGPLLRVVPSPLRGAAGRGRVAVVVRAPGAETRRLSGALEAEGIRATFALSALDGLIVVRRAADLDALRGALARARTSGVTLVAASALAGIGSEPLPLGARIAGGAAFAAFDLWRSLADLVVALAGAATLLMLL